MVIANFVIEFFEFVILVLVLICLWKIKQKL